MKKKNWFLRHKIVSAFLVILLLTTISNIGNKDAKEAFEKGKQYKEEQVANQASTPKSIKKAESLTKSDAISMLKNYEIKNDLKTIDKSTKGMAVSVYLENLVLKGMKADPTTKTGSWSASLNSDGIYNVDYSFRTLGLDQIFTWEVSKDSIKAINGKAITITPELGPQEKEVSGTDREKEIYEYSMSLYKKYESVSDSYEAETKSTKETATKFGITEEEVESIVSRLLDTKI